MHGIAQAAGMAALLAILTPQALACGFDAIVGDRFSAQHPKSISVAFAINAAVESGRISKEAIAPIEPGQSGYWRAMGRLQRFEELLVDAAGRRERLPNVSILLIDSQLWTRMQAGASGYRIEQHAAGPAPTDVVIVTNEYVLAMLDDGLIDPREALHSGLIDLDGNTEAKTIVQDELLARIAPSQVASASTAARKAPAWAKAPPSNGAQ